MVIGRNQHYCAALRGREQRPHHRWYSIIQPSVLYQIIDSKMSTNHVCNGEHGFLSMNFLPAPKPLSYCCCYNNVEQYSGNNGEYSIGSYIWVVHNDNVDVVLFSQKCRNMNLYYFHSFGYR